MTLLDNAACEIADGWVEVADDAPLPEGAPAIISLARLTGDAASFAGRNAPLGVSLPSNTRPEAVAGLLDRVSLIAIQFPVFKDGRGFTIARTLRERYGYTGEIRAVGHILPDQYVFLLRCGFTTAAIPDGVDAARFRQAIGQYDIAYQAAVTDDSPLSLLRRHVAVSDAKAG